MQCNAIQFNAKKKEYLSLKNIKFLLYTATVHSGYGLLCSKDHYNSTINAVHANRVLYSKGASKIAAGFDE